MATLSKQKTIPLETRKKLSITELSINDDFSAHKRLRAENLNQAIPEPQTYAHHNLHGMFLDHLCKYKMLATVFLTSGVKLQGVVTGFDHSSIVLRRDNAQQLVFKHAISTVLPNTPISFPLIPTLDEPEINPA